MVGGEWLLEFGRGHLEFGVVDFDAEDEVAGVGVAGGDGGAVGAGGEGGGFLVEAEVGLAGFGVGTVAGEAVLGEDGADVAVVVDGVFGGEGGGGEEEGQEGEEPGLTRGFWGARPWRRRLRHSNTGKMVRGGHSGGKGDRHRRFATLALEPVPFSTRSLFPGAEKVVAGVRSGGKGDRHRRFATLALEPVPFSTSAMIGIDHVRISLRMTASPSGPMRRWSRPW